MSQTQYSREIRAQVIADLIAGGSVLSVAKLHGIPEATVRYWKNNTPNVAHLRDEKRDELGALIYELLTENIRGLIAIAGLARDPEWARRQNADGLAIFAGVHYDKAVSILRSFRGTEETQPSPPALPE